MADPVRCSLLSQRRISPKGWFLLISEAILSKIRALMAFDSMCTLFFNKDE
jgi:hypothetical protein